MSKNLLEVYGDTIHKIDGTHSAGGIADDYSWQQRYKQLLNVPIQQYYLPSGAEGNRFINLLTKELCGIWARCWNI